MISLHDGVKPVTSISILCLVKNNEKWLNYAIKKFAHMEQIYNASFEYYFFENDSKDQSRPLLQTFMQGRKGKLLTDSLPPYKNIGVNYGRVHRLASLRNRLIQEIAPLKTDWTLLIDTDIYFDVRTLEQLFQCQPSANNIAMVTPYAHEVVTGAILKKQKQTKVTDVPDDKIFGVKHYYDTFAFVDEFNHNYWPHCIFQACGQCQKTRPKHVDPATLIPSTQDIVDVRSAFGGFAIIDTDILNDHQVRWKTLDLFGKYAVCEHVAFCDAIKNKHAKRIVVDQRVNNVMWIKEIEAD